MDERLYNPKQKFILRKLYIKKCTAGRNGKIRF